MLLVKRFDLDQAPTGYVRARMLRTLPMCESPSSCERWSYIRPRDWVSMANHFLLGDHPHAQTLGYLQLGTGILAGDDEVSLGGDATTDPGPQA